MGSRASGYSQEEDKFLCQVYMEISQDPIKGAYQTSDQFWSRVVDAYDNGKCAAWTERSKRSMQSRVQIIEKVTKKLHACIKQCENRRPSGASNDDIFNQAKLMLMEDPKFKAGWKFDHVWNIIKNFEKVQDGATSARKVSKLCGFDYTSSRSENPTPDSATQPSPSLSSFSLNLNDDDGIIGESPSQRPSGVKKSKMKRKIYEGTSAIINTIEEGNKQLLEELKKSRAQRQSHMEKKYALKQLNAQNKILFQDLNSIPDPNVRAYFQTQQTQILQTLVDIQHGHQSPHASTPFGQIFNNIGGSGSGLPDY